MTQQELNEFITNELQKTSAEVSVLVQDFHASTPLFHRDSAKRVVSASTIKTPLMLAALNLVQQGKISLQQSLLIPAPAILEDTMVFEDGPQGMTLQELLTWMIINSDNTATNVLIDFLTMPYCNQYFTEIGLHDTILERRMLDWDAITAGRNNYTSAADQFHVFEALYRNSILTPALCELALDILKQNRDFESALRYVTGCTSAHKTGSLEQLTHDTGILYLPNGGAYFFGYFITHDTENCAERLIGRLNRAVFRYFLHDA